jgi:hypothetical protein
VTAQPGVPSAIAGIGRATGALSDGQAAAVLAAEPAGLAACAAGAALIEDHTTPTATVPAPVTEPVIVPG